MRGRWTGLWFALPALSLIAVFFVGPVLAAFALSVTDFDLYALADRSRLRMVGAANYAALAEDPRFWAALRNTAYFAAVAAPLSILLSLAAAMGLTRAWVRAKTFLRTACFLPVVATLVAVAVVWRYLYHPRDGLLNLLLGSVGLDPINWLGDPRWAMPALILMAAWKNFGFNMVIFIAGIQSIPASLYEAARVDGANGWAQFRHITLPMLRPTFVFVIVMTLIGYVQLFAEPYVMTRGGPGDSTLSIVLYMYEQGFRWWNMGYAAAIAFVLFALMLLMTALQLQRTRRRAA